MAERVFIQEVVTRDGFQIEPTWIETADKVRLLDALSPLGFAKIEVSSFVSPKAVPNLRDAADVFRAIRRHPGVTYVALVPNRRGAADAFAANVDEINFVVSASETHNQSNMRMTVAASLSELAAILKARPAGVAVNFTVATAFGCPFEGDTPPARVLAMAEEALSHGADSLTLADTTGMANPRQVGALVAMTREQFPAVPLTLHFHNTRGMGLANALAAYQNGGVRFDAALGGLGGCPFAPGATGNVCTEDMVHLFETMGIETGVDLPALLDVAKGLPALMRHDVPGLLIKAGRSCDLHPVPQAVAMRAAG